jgi:hypothetical protein
MPTVLNKLKLADLLTIERSLKTRLKELEKFNTQPPAQLVKHESNLPGYIQAEQQHTNLVLEKIQQQILSF